MTRHYRPEEHDRILYDLHYQWQLDPYGIADRVGLAVDTVKHHLRRLGIEPHRRNTEQTAHEIAPTLPKERENPLQFARIWLGRRLVEKPGKGYFLDDVPVNLEQLMQAANRAAKRAGAEQCAYSERWRV